MEFASIEREIHVDATPEVVFDVVSQPEHIHDWWMADTGVAPVPGAEGELVRVDRETGERQVQRITVVDVDPPRRFVFRWTHPPGATAQAGNSLLVTFTLAPDGAGTRLRMVETGFREMGWAAAVLEAQYNDHVAGWAFFLPRLHDRSRAVATTR